MSNVEYSAEHQGEKGSFIMPPNIIGLPYDDGRDDAGNPTGELTDAEKLDYLYQVALKVGALVASITPQQVEQVQKLQRNPFLSKMFAGIIPGSD